MFQIFIDKYIIPDTFLDTKEAVMNKINNVPALLVF